MEIIKLLKEVEQRKSAETVASIDDLLILILSHLPIKPLLRFKSVSKHWLSLITNPRFCHLHNRTIGLMLPHDDTPKVQKINSAEIVASIDDLLKDILLRLPIKSLIRFKSVCKHWQTLIKNPRFHHLRNRTIGLMLPRKTDIPKAGPFYEYVPFFETALTRKLEYYKDVDLTEVLRSFCLKRYYVCNPSTNELSLVPLPEDDNFFKSEMSLAFDPAISPHYKVVCVRRSWKIFTQTFIYSSVTNAWEVCGDPFTSSFISFGDGVYWNGAVHCMGCKRHLYFKIEGHVLHEMPEIPFSNWTDKYYFGESCDRLDFVETLDTRIQFNVYELKRDYSEWFIKFQVDLSPVVVDYPEMIQAFNHPTTVSHCYNYSVCCIKSC
ncbi:hypothetical protein RD792_005194 [Penstemon davidsonii]|uniref:F-box domain-containing protein n=1 Tax=Penstemon davidsonii TaxID=160366 RepID=A0ABR0DK98_9LAMI|nr:hypothetical protein RD792_005194 [Penstemon davidsonii]